MVNLIVAVICDIDDTLLRYGDQPIKKTIEYLNSLPGPKFIVTGRSPEQRIETVKALRDAGVRFTSLYMSPKTKDDNEFKYETAMRLKRSHKIDIAIENNPKAREQYRRAGLKTLDPADIPAMAKFWNNINYRSFN